MHKKNDNPSKLAPASGGAKLPLAELAVSSVAALSSRLPRFGTSGSCQALYKSKH